jgi:peptidoglycan/LPS O-acetylase OafA/YrhL
MTCSVNRKYIPALDHIRGFAAILVLLYHGTKILGGDCVVLHANTHGKIINNLIGFLCEGHTAVGLFIVLSGFVLTLGTTGREMNYGLFIQSRVLRILPLYILCLNIAICAQPQGLLPWFTWLVPCSLTGGVQSSFTAMFWTVVIEFQLYLIFPFLISFSNKRGNVYLIGVLFLAIIFRFLAYYAEHADPKGMSYGTVLGRIDQFLIGMIAARLYLRYNLETISWRWFLIAALVAFGLIATYHRNHGSTYVGPWCNLWHTIEGVVWAGCIVSYVSFGRRIPQAISYVMSSIGQISYSIYLLHFSVIFFVKRSFAIPRILEQPQENALLVSVVMVLPITLIVSLLTYSFIENPFLGLRKKYISS